MTFPIDHVRSQFPALAPRPGSAPFAFLDAPGGTQVCRPAIARMVEHLERGTANSGGMFETSIETDALSAAAHAAAADLLGGDPGEIAFGPNMTTLTFSLSRALASDWSAGDEIVLSRLDHDANVAPWLLAARDRGVTVRWLDFDPEAGVLALDTLPTLLGPRTRLVAVGAASNAIGTVNDIAAIVATVRAAGEALVFVDAVQSAPHLPIDVGALGCDFLACSPYKIFGPHAGLLWTRAATAERLAAYKVRPSATMPAAVRFETGTPSFEAQAGVLGMIEYLQALGERCGAEGGRRAALVAALDAAAAYEVVLGQQLLDGLAGMPKMRLRGVRTMAGRVPTFGLTIDGWHPRDAAARLAQAGLFAWSGHFYAVEVIERLGLAEAGGLLRLGLCHYNTADEVDRTLAVLATL